MRMSNDEPAGVVARMFAISRTTGHDLDRVFAALLGVLILRYPDELDECLTLVEVDASEGEVPFDVPGDFGASLGDEEDAR